MVTLTRRIALHEAAHAVIARKLRLPNCGEASIDETDAHAHFPIDCGPASVVALMAGAASEVVEFGDYDRIGVRVDQERWTERLDRYGCEEAALWKRTLVLVRQHFGCINWVAVHLQYAQTLDGPAIDDIVRRG